MNVTHCQNLSIPSLYVTPIREARLRLLMEVVRQQARQAETAAEISAVYPFALAAADRIETHETRQPGDVAAVMALATAVLCMIFLAILTVA